MIQDDCSRKKGRTGRIFGNQRGDKGSVSRIVGHRKVQDQGHADDKGTTSQEVKEGM